MRSDLDDEFRGGPTRVVAIAVGSGHGLALKDNGTIVAWGNAHKVPDGLNGVTAIAAGKSHSLALKGDGTVVAWGHNNAGQAHVPAGLTGVVAIAAGQGHNLALRRDGTVVAWGHNDAGQANVPAGLTGIKAIAAGWWHSLALQSDGSVVAWGHPDSDQRHVPYGLVGAVEIAAGYENSSAIFPDGTVVDWGNDTHFWRVPDDFYGITAVSYGYRHRLALRNDGTVVSDGSFFGGIPVPTGLTDVAAIAGGQAGASSHFLALTRDGTVVGLGAPGLDDPVLDVPPELTGSATAISDSSLSPAEHVDLDPLHISDVPRETSEDLPLHNGQTALMYWSAVGNEARVRVLLNQGVDVNTVDDDGDSALYYALSNGNFQILELLLGHGADPNLAGSSGRPLLIAADQGWAEIVATLIYHGVPLDLRSSSGMTATMLAAGGGHNDVVHTLQRHGANLNAVDDDGDSALYYAASRGRVRTLNLLLSLGADPNPRPSVSGETPLTIAAALATPMHPCPPGTSVSDYTTMVLALLKAGANASLMHSKGFVLTRSTERGLEITPPELVPRLALTDDWSVSYQVGAAADRSVEATDQGAAQLNADGLTRGDSQGPANPASPTHVATQQKVSGHLVAISDPHTTPPIQTPRSERQRSVVVLSLGFIVVLLVVVIIWLLTEQGASAEQGAEVYEVSVGECMGTASLQSDQVSRIETVECSTEHDVEAFASMSLSDDSYPGEDEIQAQADEFCLAKFESFIGLSYQESEFDYSYLYPTAEGWDNLADREILCLVISPEPVTGSLEGVVR